MTGEEQAPAYATRSQFRDLRRLLVLVAVIAIGGIAGGALSVYYNGQRRDQSCATDERADRREIVQLRQTYRALEDPAQRKQLGHGLVVAIIGQLPLQERAARSKQAAAFCDGSAGLDEGRFPKLPVRRSFEGLLTPAERHQIHEQRQRGQGGSGAQTGGVAQSHQEARVRPRAPGGGRSTVAQPKPPSGGQGGSQGGGGQGGGQGGQPSGGGGQGKGGAQSIVEPVLDQVGETINEVLQLLP